MPPLVSVIVPCYNAGLWLSESLDSLLGQTYTHTEIIVVNDGSTDSSAELLRDYEKKGIKVLTQKNGGHAAALNAGFRNSTGTYIKFHDADDISTANMIETQLSSLKDKPGHVAYSKWARFYTTPEEAPIIPHPGWHDASPTDWIVETWADAKPMTQCAQFLIPRHIIDKVGGWDENLSLDDDFEYFTRILLSSDGLVFNPEPILYYRSGLPESMCSQRYRKSWKSAFLSKIGAVDHLIKAEDSPRTRLVAATVCQNLIYAMYPQCPDLIAALEKRVAEYGGTPLLPEGGRFFPVISKLLGWRATRHLQIAVGKYPRPPKE